MDSPFYRRKNRLGDLLLEEQLIDEQQLQHALTQQKKKPHSYLGGILVANNIITEQQLQHCLRLQKLLRMAIFSLTYSLSSKGLCQQDAQTDIELDSYAINTYSFTQSFPEHLFTGIHIENHFNDGFDTNVQYLLKEREEIIYSLPTDKLIDFMSNTERHSFYGPQFHQQRYFINMLNNGISLSMYFRY